jgi:uncharacterized protein YdcH (DUF465 family)
MKQAMTVLGGIQERLSQMEARHRELDARLRELGRRPYLTPHEQLEVVQIKKHKLRAKDEMAALRRGL